MKKLWKRMLSVGLVLSFLLALCPLPAAFAVNLTEAVVTVNGEGLVYNGQAQEPSVTVTYGGKALTEGTDYTLSYANNVNAGMGSVMVTGKGSYSGSKTVEFTILPYTLTAEHFAGQDPYERLYNRDFDAAPTIQTNVCGETVTLRYETARFADRYVGTHDITVSGLSVGSNYQLTFQNLTVPGQILTADRDVRTGQIEAGKTLDLGELIVNKGLTYWECKIVGSALGAIIQDNVLYAGDQAGTLTVEFYVEEEDVDRDGKFEYAGLRKSTSITITEPKQEETPPVDPPITQKQEQVPLVISGADEVTYGQTLQLSCSGGSTGGVISWDIVEEAENHGKAEISPSGLLTPAKAGKVWVTATMAGNDVYEEVSQTKEITIRQAPITITAASKSALMGEEVPALTAADYTITGLVGGDQLSVLPALTYETAPDMSREGEVAILVSGAAVPAGGNYDPNITYVPGKLTIGLTYPITVSEAEGGTVTADMPQAPAGATVTLTIQPEEGFALDILKVESGSTVIQTAEAGEGKHTFTMPDGGVLVTPVFVPEVPEELPFTDVKEGDWFYDSVAYVYFNGLMNGTSDTTFTPNGTTNRGMIVTILYRLAGSPETAAWSPFQDVDPSQYYAAPIAWAAWNGIVSGKTATTFGPNDPITREQMAAILYRYAKSQGMDVSQTGNLTQFRDQGSISPYAVEALSWANGAGLITGKGEGILDPQGPAVRAQVAAIFQRFCESAKQ